ncbi:MULTISPECIES: hypothetical protein [Streptomyces]|uniref:hypothetical protein n=1 Tax=Streptomyces TaxID=1883 RepID=UPI00025CDF79|nr:MULTISPECIES: hypothetical protein [Streptomyces]AZK98792.1 hypothetical protein B7R87_33060 [Streptomyces tsukubensis]EIF87921.1 hypothetical protein [Streptomyces tsukubensis NRRL18488]MYS65133.1 hypothetical protein [Streptomyces sp. SID5473]
MAGPQRMAPPPDDEDDDIEVTPETIARDRKRRQAEEKAAQAMTRRSWYTRSAVADAFQAAVDDIHHSTRAPKHEVVAALLEAAVGQSARVERTLSKAHPSHK